MPDFLRIGPLTLDIDADSVQRSNAFEDAPSTRAPCGFLQSSTAVVKSRWTVRTLGLTDADASALLAAARPGSFVECSGAILGGVAGTRTVECLVEVLQEVLEMTADGGFLRAYQLTLHEA